MPSVPSTRPRRVLLGLLLLATGSTSSESPGVTIELVLGYDCRTGGDAR